MYDVWYLLYLYYVVASWVNRWNRSWFDVWFWWWLSPCLSHWNHWPCYFQTTKRPASSILPKGATKAWLSSLCIAVQCFLFLPSAAGYSGSHRRAIFYGQCRCWCTVEIIGSRISSIIPTYFGAMGTKTTATIATEYMPDLAQTSLGVAFTQNLEAVGGGVP